jgi:hypothetical protein
MPVANLFDRIVGKNIGDGAVAEFSEHTDGEILEFTAPSDLYILQLDLSNVETTGVQVTIELETDAKTINWVKGVQIPVGATISIVEGQKAVLKSGDKLRIKCDTAGETVDAFISFIREVNT